MALEAINNAGSLKEKNLIIVSNDNDKSISDNVGAIHHYLGKVPPYRDLAKIISACVRWRKVRSSACPMVGDKAREAAGRAETSFKAIRLCIAKAERSSRN